MTDNNKYYFKVTTIVPALNEQGNIDEFCRQFDEMASKAPFENELLFIDDGSTDDTLKKIEENMTKYSYIKSFSHHRNRGLTEALETGFANATGDVYTFYPADLQYKPEDIPTELIQALKDLKGNYKYNYSRFNKPRSKGQYSLTKKSNKEYSKLSIKEFASYFQNELQLAKSMIENEIVKKVNGF